MVRRMKEKDEPLGIEKRAQWASKEEMIGRKI